MSQADDMDPNDALLCNWLKTVYGVSCHFIFKITTNIIIAVEVKYAPTIQ